MTMSEKAVFLKQGRAAENKFSHPQSFSLFISYVELSTLELHHSELVPTTLGYFVVFVTLEQFQHTLDINTTMGIVCMKN